MRHRDEFAIALRGRRARANGLVVHVGTDPNRPVDSTARVGVIVGKPVGPAVTRNLVRRRIRHLCRPLLSQLSPSALIVVRALPAAAEMSSPQLDRSLREACRRLEVFSS